MNDDTTLHAKDLTQLSSREQLSALMDGALSADETRFLLRRLQHDASLAECWQRWRLAGEVMRGLAPAQRLPADFANRVAASLHGDAVPLAQAGTSRSRRTPAWLRWGGGAAMAASLAVAALVVEQPGIEASPEPAAAMVVATTDTAAAPQPQAAETPVSAAGAVAAAGALAAVARPARAPRREQQVAPAARQVAEARTTEVAPLQVAANSETLPLMAQPDIVTRPWPRSVLPQYANSGLAVGFGNQGGVTYSPFQAQAALAPTPVQADAGESQPATVDADGPPPSP